MKKFVLAALSIGVQSQVLIDPLPEPDAKYESEVLTVIDNTEAPQGYSMKVKNSSFRRSKNEKLYMEFGLTIEGPP